MEREIVSIGRRVLTRTKGLPDSVIEMRVTTEHEIEVWRAGEVTWADFFACCTLYVEAFPKPGRTAESVAAASRGVWIDNDFPADTEPRRYVIRDGERVVAMASTLVRRIETAAGPMKVLGLADVATAASHRGRGLGDRVILAAWSRLAEDELRCCLFQTGSARGFYEKRGARVVDNRFVDSTHPTQPQKNPFTDEVAMVYPASADWPTGEIDLCGPGY